MPDKVNWIRYAHGLYTEWQQCRDEGRMVGQYEEICRKIAESYDDAYEKVAHEIGEILKNAPIREGYEFVEPSEYDEIQAAKPKKRHTLNNSLKKDELTDKIQGAWIGRISGCLLGKPVEGFMSDRLYKLLKGTGNYPMNRYITSKDFTKEVIEEVQPGDRCWVDTIGGIAPIDDDTNYTVLALKLLEEYGWEYTPDDVAVAWLSYIPYFETCTAERVAYRNRAIGIYPPQTATYKNPYREWIGAQIRGDFFGYINPGDAEKAAELAWRDGYISHVKNGIYGEMFVAAMIAAAAVCDDISTVIEAGLDEIPEKKQIAKKY